MDFSGYTPFIDKELGGGADYDNPTMIPMGLATVCRNMRFRRRSVRTRDGYSHTMSYEIEPSTPSVPPFDMTGVEALDVLVNNPQQLVIAFDTNGDLLQESPVGSGTMIPLSPPIPLPTGASMQTAKAYNRIYMAFSNLMKALGPPQVIDGPTGVVSPVSQTPIGAIWTPGTYYLPGDVVRTSQNPSRWFRCIVAGTAGNVEPTWPTLDGYLAPTPLVANIISVSTVNIGTVGHPVLVTNFVLSSVAGISVGDAITIAGVTPGSFDGAVTVQIVSTNIIQTTRAGTSNAGDNGAGGTFTDNSQTTYSGVPAEVTDPNGPSRWVEWTPNAAQFVPQPEAPELVLSIKGQSGAPVGTIAAGQDVYVCFAYQNAVGESQWTQPIVYESSVAADVIEVFFQKQNEVPGPTVPATHNAVGYGGPRMPQWLTSVLGLSDPVVKWPTLKCLNVYVAAVAHNAAAPTQFYQYLSGASVYRPVVISSIPATGTLFAPRATPTAGLTKLPFIGSSGPRYMAVERLDLNDSLVPIDPGSPLLFNFLSSIAGSGTANITFIQRSANSVVTCTVDLLAGFAQGSQVIIAGVTNSDFDGTFTLTGVSPNQYGGATLIWTQTGVTTVEGSSGGTATSASAAQAFVTPQDLIASISRSANVVTAVVNSLQGITVGAEIAVADVAGTATSFNGGPFTIVSVTPNLGGGGSITWAQTAADDTGTGYTGVGVVSPTGAGTGTNAPQTATIIGRVNNVGEANFQGADQPNSPPPGFQSGAIITVADAPDSSLNGTFTITGGGPVFNGPAPGGVGGWYITWNQAGANIAPEPAEGALVTLITGGGPQQGQGNITSIARAGNVVTAALDNTENFVLGAQVAVTGVADTSYDGTFFLTSVTSTQLQWSQIGPNSASTGGEVTQTSGGVVQPTPVAVLPPGGPFIAQDIAAWGVEGGVQAGPFTFIPAQDPVTPFSATIQSIGAVNGTVTALLSSTSGLQAGDTIQVAGTPNGWFDGVFVLAQVNQNTVVWAGVGPGIGFTGGTVSLVPTQPTDAMGQNNPVGITTLSRLASGIVSAQITDVANLEPGMRIQVVGTADPGFAGQFVVLSVSQNQLPGSTTPLAGTATWQSSTLMAASTTGGTLAGLPGIILDAIDNDLANADGDVTPQLSTIPAPSCVNVFFSPALNMMVYTIGQDSSHYFSNPGDAANIASPGGILGINESNGERTRGFVETISGELISLKEKSGYEVTVGSSTPNEWGVSRRWFGHGPCGPRAWDAADDFIIYFDEDAGPYRYHQGVAMQIGQEKQGTWDRLTKTASAQVCVAIDNIRKEIHFALPLDGSTVPNHDLVLNYFNGWEEPLMLTMTGEMMPNPHGRRWSDNDGAASGGLFRLIKVIQRTLPSPPSPIIVHRQVVFCLSGIAQAEGATGYIDMSVPEQMNDNGAAIAPQYQPAFAQSPTLETLVWDKMKCRALGLGALQPLSIQPVTEDPNADLAPVTLDLSDGLPDSRTLGLSAEVNELFSVLYTNEDPDTGLAIAGAGFELHRSVKYGKIRTAGTPEDQGSS